MKILFLCLLTALPVFSLPRSLQFAATKTATVTVPSAAPFTSVGDFRVDLRMHGVVPPSPAAYSDILIWSGFQVKWHVADHVVLFCDNVDTFPGGSGNCIQADVGVGTEMVLRFRRDTAAKAITVEMWTVAGANYTEWSLTWETTGAYSVAGALTIGGTETVMSVPYIRFMNSAGELNAQPPNGAVPAGLLIDYEFEDNGNDSSGNGVNLTLYSSPVFVDTPLYAPTAVIGENTTSVVVGSAGRSPTVDGTYSFSPNDGAALAYFWQCLSTSSGVLPRFSSHTAGTPALTGVPAGNYLLQLQVTDSRGVSTLTTKNVGLVGTDTNGVVTTPDSRLDALFGPITKLWTAPWRYYDERHWALSERFGSLQSSSYLDTWNTAAAGTISVTSVGGPGTNSTVTGSGTSFQTLFCSGGTTSDGSNIVLFYPRVDGSMGRRNHTVVSCTSNTSLTITPGYYYGAVANGIQYSRWVPDGTWFNGSGNANYYDSVAAFYSLYYRTGLTRYRDYARTLADRWWSNPIHDGGFTCDGISGNWCVFPRVRSLLGIYLRAVDGKSEYWPGLRTQISGMITDITGNAAFIKASYFSDMREASYELAFVSLCAWLDPDVTQRATCAAAVKTAVERYATLQKTDGTSGKKYWESITFAVSPWNGYAGTVTATNGSNQIVGSGTTLTYCQVGDYFRITTDPSDPYVGDAASLPTVASVEDATHLTLSAAYSGSYAGSGRGWQCGALIGNGIQPFQIGIAGNALHFAAQALTLAGETATAAIAEQMVKDTQEWVAVDGLRPSTGGLWYGRYYPPCVPISEASPNACINGDIYASRDYGIETFGTNAMAKTYGGGNNTFGDQQLGRSFGKYQDGPYSDAYWFYDIDDGGFWYNTLNAKYHGFIYGFGLSPAWIGARLGGRQAPDVRTYPLSFTLAEGADLRRLYITRPSGEPATVDCPSSPCSFTYRADLGSHVMYWEDRTTGGTVLARSDPMQVQ